ncbi:MAG: hypothetical protein LBH31_01145 [Burkholderiaceae bacterium]|nr:hypothetical protein [Burkholderiaceae bacterium]
MESMIVIAMIDIMATFALPSYQQRIIKAGIQKGFKSN